MPADYQSAARALSVSPVRTPSPRNGYPNNDNNYDTPSTAAGRLSSTRFRSRSSFSSSAAAGSAPRSVYQQVKSALETYNEYWMRIWNRMSILQRIITTVAVLTINVLLILGMVYSHRLFDWLANVSTSWRALPGGWIICFLLVCITAFPPVIGYATATTIAGFVYGFPWGWPIVAVGSTVGSLGAFMAGRTFLSKPVDRMVGKDPRFVALGQVLRRDGIWYLTGIRFCPLPFSLSNGFLATIPSITPAAFALSTALSTPKLLVHVFIGSRLAILAENGDDMSFGDRLVNYLSMAIGGAVGLAVGWVIYRRTMARAAELALEDNAEEEGFARRHGAYLDNEDTLMDPEDAAALMSDDDMSLWDTQVEDYTDEPRDDGKASGGKKSSQDGDFGEADRDRSN